MNDQSHITHTHALTSEGDHQTVAMGTRTHLSHYTVDHLAGLVRVDLWYVALGNKATRVGPNTQEQSVTKHLTVDSGRDH